MKRIIITEEQYNKYIFLIKDKGKTIKYFQKSIDRMKNKTNRVLYKAMQELNIRQ